MDGLNRIQWTGWSEKRTYIADIERGERNVSLENIDKISNSLEISTSSLFGHYVNGEIGE
ncbi:MAG: helix-turn-helix domain-containing protein [Thermoleophilia bacterium]